MLAHARDPFQLCLRDHVPVIEPRVLTYKGPLQHLSDLPGLWHAFYSFFFLSVSGEMASILIYENEITFWEYLVLRMMGVARQFSAELR